MKSLLTLSLILLSIYCNSQSIFKSIKKGKIKKVEQYLKKNKIVSDTFFYSKDDPQEYALPLTYAVFQNQFEIVKTLIKDSLKIPNFREQISTAFAVSMCMKNDTLSNYLFNLNPDLSVPCLLCGNQSAIMIAVFCGNEKWYFKLKPLSYLNQSNINGENLMHLAILGNEFSQKIFDDILNTPQININQLDSSGNQPIDYALLDNKEVLFYQIESQIKKLGLKVEVSNVTAALSGNLKLFNYVETNYFKYSVWENTDYYTENWDEDFYGSVSYLLEDAIIGNNVEIVKIIYNRMLNDIINEKDKKAYKVGILVAILSFRYIDEDCKKTFHPLYYALFKNKNKNLFEFLITKSVEFNNYEFRFVNSNNIYRTKVEGTAHIYFFKSHYRWAKITFGKSYVEKLYNDLDISFYHYHLLK